MVETRRMDFGWTTRSSAFPLRSLNFTEDLVWVIRLNINQKKKNSTLLRRRKHFILLSLLFICFLTGWSRQKSYGIDFGIPVRRDPRRTHLKTLRAFFFSEKKKYTDSPLFRKRSHGYAHNKRTIRVVSELKCRSSNSRCLSSILLSCTLIYFHMYRTIHNEIRRDEGREKAHDSTHKYNIISMHYAHTVVCTRQIHQARATE